MSAQTIILLVLIGLAAGFLSGMIGVGGGIIIVPALVYLLQFSQKDAQGTSLAVLLLPIGIFAAYQYYIKGHVKVPHAGIIVATFIVGSIFGSKLASDMDDNKLKKIFAVIMMLLAIKMLFLDRDKSKIKNTAQTASVADADTANR